MVLGLGKNKNTECSYEHKAGIRNFHSWDLGKKINVSPSPDERDPYSLFKL